MDELPEGQRDLARHISWRVEEAKGYVGDFAAALELFDHAAARARARERRADALKGAPGKAAIDGERRHRLAAARMRSWRMIAARDGAMTVYHFFMALGAIDEQLRLGCPDLLALLPEEPFAAVAAIRRKRFKDYEKLRHAIGHAAELHGTRRAFEKNAIGGNLVLPQYVHGREFSVSIGGKTVRYEMSPETLGLLRTMLAHVLGAFGEAYRALGERHWARMDALAREGRDE